MLSPMLLRIQVMGKDRGKGNGVIYIVNMLKETYYYDYIYHYHYYYFLQKLLYTQVILTNYVLGTNHFKLLSWHGGAVTVAEVSDSGLCHQAVHLRCRRASIAQL